MNMIFYLYVVVPAVVALLLAAAGPYFLRRGRKGTSVALPRGVRTLSAVGMAASLGLMITSMAWFIRPWWVPGLDDNGILILQLAHFTIPLILTVVALIFLVFPAPSPGPGGTAALAPRTIMTFTPRGWLGIAAGVLLLVAAVSIFAGVTSEADEAGRYLSYGIKLSATTSGSTMIYGWWFSVRCPIPIMAILALIATGMVRISRPALALDAAADSATRTTRIRNILTAATGGLLLHLSTITQSLSDTASLQVGMAGWFDQGTSFAAMGPALSLAATLALVLGLAMWWFILLQTVPVRVHKSTKPVPA